MNSAESTWEQVMWDELAAMDPVDQYVATGEWITRMTQVLLPRLGTVRRQAVLAAVGREGWDAVRLAETVGARPTTIKRLVEEGRAARRETEAVA